MENDKTHQEGEVGGIPRSEPRSKGHQQQKGTKKWRSNTINGRRIEELLRLTKKKGNPKDFVIIVGYRLIDYWADYNLINEAGKTIGVEKGIALIHKKDLHKVLGEEFAAKFWRRKAGMRVPGKTNEQLKKDAEQAKQR